ncbi:FadR/GntR family transcriptional regulator [Clostridium magnum]|uniref:HTH-type transcriptional regulator LutR n=1 Tax=Clostridium magnum DSM 2767 TaxID=1121326 RepID=A0A161WX82_9CLOT|nr:FadR/GntR family transcriptional regulator [Clostridium magnum]KZL91558.1 HTH-type transcriptional regulator LutR [Clostridium magnum DSM 2767]SHH47531.1 transcriptional regulator, GntR family [Clostridium magnum DSM 2767]
MKEFKTSDIVFKTIQEKIFNGEWKPGEKIMSEPQLSKELNVSRVSVREAIEKLATLNIISKRQGEGTFVNDLKPSIYLNSLIPMITLDKDNYLDILEFRLITEPKTARMCAEKCNGDTLKEIEESYERMLDWRQDIKKFTEEDLNFHMKIAEGSGNSLIIKVNEILRNLLEYHQRELYKTLGPSGGLSEHKLILDAIKNRDSELADIYMVRHLERTIKDIKEMRYK